MNSKKKNHLNRDDIQGEMSRIRAFHVSAPMYVQIFKGFKLVKFMLGKQDKLPSALKKGGKISKVG